MPKTTLFAIMTALVIGIGGCATLQTTDATDERGSISASPSGDSVTTPTESEHP